MNEKLLELKDRALGVLANGQLSEPSWAALQEALMFVLGLQQADDFRLAVRDYVRPECLHRRSPASHEDWAELYVNTAYLWVLLSEPGWINSGRVMRTRRCQFKRFVRLALDSSVK